uniref:Uncharacterized protein n=1 Tax=Zonotrichia albicollis TaxID=44394 RepID=A0A8D2NC34_ZONAL
MVFVGGFTRGKNLLHLDKFFSVKSLLFCLLLSIFVSNAATEAILLILCLQRQLRLTAIHGAPEQILLHRKAMKLLVALHCCTANPVLVSVPTPWLIYNCDKSPGDNQGAVTLLQLKRNLRRKYKSQKRIKTDSYDVVSAPGSELRLFCCEEKRVYSHLRGVFVGCGEES